MVSDENQKLENLLNLALDATPEELEKSPDLSAGYQKSTDTWTLIVKYVQDLSFLADYGITPVELLGNYAILEVPRSLISAISAREEIIYVEKPKNLSFTVIKGRSVSCVSQVQTPLFQTGVSGLALYGSGCIVGIVDSGIDYANPVFQNPDGSTRILALWDQSETGIPPAGYTMGAYYDKAMIDEALTFPDSKRQQEIVKSTDNSGHGTAVASIAAGNFASDRSLSLGMATKSGIIAVKLAAPSSRSFPRTSELMQAVDFVVKTAIRLGRPLALNLSFGNNYGSHTGTSLLETYLNEAVLAGRCSLIIGMGNEGISAIHTSGNLSTAQTSVVELSIAPYEPSLNLQLWKSYYDEFEIVLTAPSGTSVTIPSSGPAAYRYSLNQTELLVYYGEPAPYSTFQEIYFDFLPSGSYLYSGLWTISLTGKKIKNGEYQFWLPVSSSLNGSRFPAPTPYGTLTIPSTAGRGISVGAYNPYDFSAASFSGRGYEDFSIFSAIQKPDLTAPGVDIITAAPGGGFVTNSGTSMAAPFVTGAAAMLMEWGIINGNDPFLYGEKIKAYLINGAKPLPGFAKYPNPQAGWGALCVADSIPTR